MIRKLLLSTVTLVTVGGTAFAADLPSRRAPPVFVPPIPVFSWTGFYVGGQIGLGFGRSTTSLRAANGLGPTTNFSNQPNGVLGGGHVGYNFSTQSLGVPLLGGFGAGGLVIGVEADIDGTDYRATSAFGAGALTSTFTNRKQVEGSARGRIGVAVDRALFYATGGAAFTQFQTTSTYTRGALTVFNPQSAQTRVGWTVGGGVEYAITTQWSLRAEYRYADFGSYGGVLASPAGAVAARFRNIQQRAQVGFSYKFDTPVAPVVARY